MGLRRGFLIRSEMRDVFSSSVITAVRIRDEEERDAIAEKDLFIRSNFRTISRVRTAARAQRV